MNELGVNAFVWANGWSKEECAHAIGNSAEVGFDLIEIAALDPKSVDIDFPPPTARNGQDRLHHVAGARCQ